jgi:hypothetical protein
MTLKRDIVVMPEAERDWAAVAFWWSIYAIVISALVFHLAAG